MSKFKELLKLFWTFFKIGAFTFGGGYAMIAMMEREVSETNKWVTKEEIADLIVVAESTPGPIAINAATFVGYKHLGFWGSFAATLGIILPSFVIIVAIAFAFDAFKDNKWLDAAFWGIRAAVIALIVNTVIMLFKTMERNLAAVVAFLIAFLIMTFFSISVIYIILAGGIFGLVWQAILANRLKKQTAAETADESAESEVDE